MHCRPRWAPSRPGASIGRSGGARGGAAYLVLGGFAAARTRLPLLSVAGAARFCCSAGLRVFVLAVSVRAQWISSPACKLLALLSLQSWSCVRAAPLELRPVETGTSSGLETQLVDLRLAAAPAQGRSTGCATFALNRAPHAVDAHYSSSRAAYATSPHKARQQGCDTPSPHCYAPAPPSSATASP